MEMKKNSDAVLTRAKYSKIKVSYSEYYKYVSQVDNSEHVVI